MGLYKILYNHVYQFISKVAYINWHHSVNSCPIFIIFFLFCSCFRAASIHCKSRVENQLENFDLNPLMGSRGVYYSGKAIQMLQLQEVSVYFSQFCVGPVSSLHVSVCGFVTSQGLRKAEVGNWVHL